MNTLKPFCKKFDINIGFKYTSTVKSLLVTNKTYVDKTAGVYKISCKDCDLVYVGETGRDLDIRKKIINMLSRHHHNQPFVVHCRTKAFPNLFHLSVRCQGTPSCSSKWFNFIPPPLSALTPLTGPRLPLCYPFYPSVVSSAHDMSCPRPFPHVNRGKNILNLRLFPYPCCSFPICPSNAEHFPLHSSLCTS